MSNPPRKMTTRASNATQHPGHVVMPKPRQPASPSGKTAKVKKAEAAAAAKAAKAKAKELKSARISKFKEDAMDMEDLLEATPRPDITPTGGHTFAAPSDLSAAGSVLESDVDTDEVNADKATYQPGSTTEDDSTSELSALPTSPSKRSYAEVASPKRKGGASKPAVVAQRAKPAAASSKAASTAMLAKSAAAKLTAPQPKQSLDSATESDSATEPDSPPPPPPFKGTGATKTLSKTQPTTSSNKAKPAQSAAAPQHNSAPPTTTQSPPLDPKTPAPSKKMRRKKAISPTVSETEPDSPPRESKPRSLQRAGSCRDLAQLDEDRRKSKAVPKKLASKPAAEKALKGKSKAPIANVISSWNKWNDRAENAGEPMDVDLPVEEGAAVVPEKKTKKKARAKESELPQDQSSDIEIVDNFDPPKGKGKNVEGKGKGKAKDVEMGTSRSKVVPKLVVPMLPTGGKVTGKRPHQNVDREVSTNPK